ncbi:MAG: hypothetical protein LBD49_01215 [Oscillospiraceae bacterium]|jgi:hypothetical protein|nr:hypothetical protein [Oscillospiraceae bacterium]
MTKKARRPRARGDAFIKLITALLFAAFSLYCGLNVYRSLENPFRTARAARAEILETSSARGFVVREELVIPGVEGLLLPSLGDGEKAARGQLVAEAYGEAAAGDAARLVELELKIKRLREASVSLPEERARRTEDSVTALAYALARRELGEAREKAAEAESLVMYPQDAASAASETVALEAELRAAEAALPRAVHVYAPESGLYAHSADGFEHITPDMLSGLSPEGIESLFAFPETSAGAGRLVTGTRWYLALIVDSASASALLETDSVTVRLTTPVRRELEMRVESVGKSDGKARVAVLSSSYGIADVLNARACGAELIYGGTEGVRVPRDAVRLEPEDGGGGELVPFIYIAEGHRAKRARVTILREAGNAYIVESASPSLRDGSEVIVKANGLYDGKVVR